MIELTEAEIAMVLRHREQQARLAAIQASDAECEAKRVPAVDPQVGDSIMYYGARQTISLVRKTVVHVQSPEVNGWVAKFSWTKVKWWRAAKAPGADVRKRTFSP